MICCPSFGGALIELSFEGQFVDLVCCVIGKDGLDPKSGHLLRGYINTFIGLSDQNGGLFTLTKLDLNGGCLEGVIARDFNNLIIMLTRTLLNLFNFYISLC